MKRLIECVPNFSEGRDPAKVDAIVGAMSSVPGVYVLDREMDADHHRCVITLAGEPDAVAEAALLGTRTAMGLIDPTETNAAHQLGHVEGKQSWVGEPGFLGRGASCGVAGRPTESADPRAGVHQPHGVGADGYGSCVGKGAARRGALRYGAGRKRIRRAGAEQHA